MRIRVGLVGLLVCAALAGCTRTAPEPRPDQTLEPSITESSPMPTANPDNPACELLTKKDRSDLVGYSMDVEVPVRPAKGSAECIWVHSLRESARSAIRVIAFSGQLWSRYLKPQLRAAMLRPTTGRALSAKLEKIWKELDQSAGQLPPDQICPTYLLLAESRGAVRGDDSLFYATIGSMTAAYAMACEDGNMIVAGYGEYGIGPSIALHNGVLRLLAAAEARAGDIFEQIELEVGGPEAAGDADADADADTDGDQSLSPEPAPIEPDEGGTEGDTETDSETEDEDES